MPAKMKLKRKTAPKRREWVRWMHLNRRAGEKLATMVRRGYEHPEVPLSRMPGVYAALVAWEAAKKKEPEHA